MTTRSTTSSNSTSTQFSNKHIETHGSSWIQRRYQIADIFQLNPFNSQMTVCKYNITSGVPLIVFLTLPLHALTYGGKLWRVETLADLANDHKFTKVSSAKILC